MKSGFFLVTLSLVASLFAVDTFAASISTPAIVTNGLVGHWTFDGKHTNWVTQRMADASGTGNTATLVNTATTSVPTIGRLGQGFRLDGVNDHVAVPRNSGLEPTQISVGAWVKFYALNPSEFQGIVRKDPYSGDKDVFLLKRGDNGGAFGFSVGIEGGIEKMAPSATIPQVGRWYHVVGTFDGSNVRIYVNGKLEGTTAASGSIQWTNTTDYLIGVSRASPVAEPVSGFVDDVRIYNRPLSASEITLLYNQSAGSKSGASMSPGTLSSGLAGHWTMDGKNINSVTRVVRDSGSGGNTGVLQGSIATTSMFKAGKVGQSIAFNGSTNYISAGTAQIGPNEGSPFAYSFWIYKPNIMTDASDEELVINLKNNADGSYAYFRTFGGDLKISFGHRDSGGAQYGALWDISEADYLSLFYKKWAHMAFVYDGGTITSATSYKWYLNGVEQSFDKSIANIGGSITTNLIGVNVGEASSFLNGSLDDIRVYSRALSLSEVRALYALGGGSVKIGTTISPGSTGSGLVGHWTFDGKTLNWGTRQAIDSSTTANLGTIVNAPTTTAPVLGRIGQGFRFDGVDDYIQVSDNSAYSLGTSLSITLWVKTTDASADFIGNFETSSPFKGFAFSIDGQGEAPGKLSFFASDTNLVGFKTDTGAAINDGRWHHVAVTHDGANARFYRDGALSSAVALSEPVGNSSNVLKIGIDNNTIPGRMYDGVMDDLRLYNKVLTLAEIQALYKNGR